MYNQRFGQIVESLRRDLRDYETDKPWSQEKLGEVSGLGKATIGKIERGKQAKLGEEILLPLANALNLHTFMRREFFTAAVGVEQEWPLAECGQAAEQAYQHVESILDEVCLPAYLFDPFCDLIALNEPMMRFHCLSAESLAAMQQAPAGANVLALLFQPSSPLHESMGRRWEAIARSNVQQFLFTSLRFRYTERFREVLPALKRLQNFRSIYREQRESPDDFYSQLRQFEYQHVKYGFVRYVVTNTATRTPFGRLTLATFVPLDVATAETFLGLAEAGTGVHRVAPWPNPEFCN